MALLPPNPLLDHLRNSLERSSSSLSPSGSQELLSPLVVGSPTASPMGSFSIKNFTPLSTSQAPRIFIPPSPPKTNGKGKAPDLSIYAWQRLALQTRKNMDVVDKKRRISTNGGRAIASMSDGPSPMKKRARKRLSSEYRLPRTDKDLANRFKEVQTCFFPAIYREHELRWAQEAFLQVIRNHIKVLNASTLQMPWHIWLAMNPESDAAAIWLERKFDVPDSGTWQNENVLSIPISSANGSANGYPGVIVFECTPLGDVTDNLERKYRVLDDYARMREIIKALPPKRHFIPSLLVICWTEGEQTPEESDFFDMVLSTASANCNFIISTCSNFLSKLHSVSNKYSEMDLDITIRVSSIFPPSAGSSLLFRIWIPAALNPIRKRDWIELSSSVRLRYRKDDIAQGFTNLNGLGDYILEKVSRAAVFASGDGADGVLDRTSSRMPHAQPERWPMLTTQPLVGNVPAECDTTLKRKEAGATANKQIKPACTLDRRLIVARHRNLSLPDRFQTASARCVAFPSPGKTHPTPIMAALKETGG
uniref:Uncharacterized protein n=1 Tax=Psilocybe cubensis TaxID=181762 RepID=A0A8H7XML3_PSICU